MEIGGIYEIEYTDWNPDQDDGKYGQHEQKKAICQIGKILKDFISLNVLAGDYPGLEIPTSDAGVPPSNRGMYSIQSVKPARKEDLLPYIGSDFFDKSLEALIKSGPVSKEPRQKYLTKENSNA
jgi:hypothetical protein